MIHVAICDDAEEILEELSEYLRQVSKETEGGLEIACFRRAEELEFRIMEKWQYHVVFLDIELGDRNGIAIAAHIRDKYPGTVVIFITGHEQYVYDSFKVQPLDFLRKPLRREDVESTFLRALKLCDIMPVWEYRSREILYRVPLAEVCCFISDKRTVKMQTRKGEHTFYGKLDDTEKKLASRSVNFIRISKSVIINMRYVRKIDYRRVRLENDGTSWEFSISQAYRVQVRKYCIDMWKD